MLPIVILLLVLIWAAVWHACVSMDSTLTVHSSYAIKKPYQSDAGVDMPACLGLPLEIKPKSFASVPTDLVFDIPPGHYVQVFGRSGLCFKNQVMVGAGVIDRGYTGKVNVAVFNMGDKPIVIKDGDKIAQAVCIKIVDRTRFSRHVPSGVASVSGRGDRGFGSSGR